MEFAIRRIIQEEIKRNCLESVDLNSSMSAVDVKKISSYSSMDMVFDYLLKIYTVANGSRPNAMRYYVNGTGKGYPIKNSDLFDDLIERMEVSERLTGKKHMGEPILETAYVSVFISGESITFAVTKN